MSESTQVLDPEQTEATPPETEATPPNDEQEADELLAELDAENGTESQQGTTGTASTEDHEPDEDEETRAAIEARAAELAEERAREAEEQRKAEEAKAKAKEEQDKFEESYRGRIEAIEQFCVQNGMDPESARRVTATFNAHHADAGKMSSSEFSRKLMQAAGLEDQDYQDEQSLIEAIKESVKSEATKGMISETQHKRELANGLLAFERRFYKDPDFRTRKDAKYRGAGAHNGAGNGSSRYSTEHALNVAYNNQEVDTATYAREYERLTGKKP